MNCEKIREIILSSIVDKIKNRKVQNHISTCENCKQYFNEISNCINILNSYSAPELSINFKSKVLNISFLELEKTILKRKILFIFLAIIASLPLILAINYFWLFVETHLLSYILPDSVVRYFIFLLVVQSSFILATVYGTIPILIGKQYRQNYLRG